LRDEPAASYRTISGANSQFQSYTERKRVTVQSSDETTLPGPQTTMLPQENRYAEVGENFRYYLTWREKLFAGFIVINGALAVAFTWLNDRYPTLTFLLPIGGMFLSILFLLLDSRNNELFNACVEAGAELETPGTGVYTKLNADPKTISHTRVIEVAVWVWTAALGAATAMLFMRKH
jgi:hypothetical protein